MSSRERRLLDKDKEIRKLKSTAGHYFACTINGAIENEKLKQELETTRKALDKARYGLEWIFGYENVPEYVVKHVRETLDQINEITEGRKDDVI